MSGKKGMGRYSEEIKGRIAADRKQGASIKSLSKKYGVSRYSVQSWCGLRPEVEFRHAAPGGKGGGRSNSAGGLFYRRLRRAEETKSSGPRAAR